VPARVIVIAGPSGSGKSQLCRRLGLPYVNLDDFYKDGGDPSLPLRDGGLVDWDHPGSWLHDDAVDAVETLCRDGEADVPVYDISRDGRLGHRVLSLAGSPYFVAEGVFAQEIVAECSARGLLADAICVHNHRVVTFWRRLRRDLREHRKPPMVLLRRGVSLMRAEPQVVAHAVALGCAPMSTHQAYARVRRLLSAVDDGR
jgi:uridine kinase